MRAPKNEKVTLDGWEPKKSDSINPLDARQIISIVLLYQKKIFWQ